MVNIIIGNVVPDSWEECASDINNDGNIDVLDILETIQFILN